MRYYKEIDDETIFFEPPLRIPGIPRDDDPEMEVEDLIVINPDDATMAEYGWMPYPEPPEVPDIEVVRAAKLSELSMACENAIVNEFYSEVTGERVHYGYDVVDQQNWNSLYEAVKLAMSGVQAVVDQLGAMGFPPGYVGIKGKGDAPYAPVTYEQYMSFWLEGTAHVMGLRVLKYYPLRTAVEEAESVGEVQAVRWGWADI